MDYRALDELLAFKKELVKNLSKKYYIKMM